MKEGLLPDTEDFGKFACGKVFSVLFHFGLMFSFCVAAAAAVYADFTTDEGGVDEFFEEIYEEIFILAYFFVFLQRKIEFLKKRTALEACKA